MAKVGDVKIVMDRFITDSRLKVCMARGCLYSQMFDVDCSLKEISIDEFGRCRLFKEKEST